MIPGDFQNTLSWSHLRKHITEQIDELRTTLEVPSNKEHTAMIRGRIAELRKLIADVEPRQVEVADTKVFDRPLY